jgi:hypothetical protein
MREMAIIAFWVSAMLIALSAHAAAEPIKEAAQAITRLDDQLAWSPITLAMCFAGWAISLISEWGVKWNLTRICFKDYLHDNVPRVIIGALSVATCYVLIPELIDTFHLEMRMNNLGAFITGLSADVIVHRIRGLVPQPPSVREDARQQVRKRLDEADDKAAIAKVAAAENDATRRVDR